MGCLEAEKPSRNHNSSAPPRPVPRNLLVKSSGAKAFGPGGRGSSPPHVVSGSHDRTVRVWCTSTLSCLAVLSDHSSPVAALAACGPFLVSLAPGEGVLAYCCESPCPPPDRGGGAAARLRSRVARARGETGGFRNVLSVLDGAAVSFQAAVAAHPECLVLGTRTGEVVVLDYAAAAAVSRPQKTSSRGGGGLGAL